MSAMSQKECSSRRKDNLPHTLTQRFHVRKQHTCPPSWNPQSCNIEETTILTSVLQDIKINTVKFHISRAFGWLEIFYFDVNGKLVESVTPSFRGLECCCLDLIMKIEDTTNFLCISVFVSLTEILKELFWTILDVATFRAFLQINE